MTEEKKKQKPGRPKSNNPKNKRFHYRMDIDGEAQLNRIASYLKTSKNLSIKMALDMFEKRLNIPRPTKMSEDDEDFYILQEPNTWEDEDFDEDADEFDGI